MQKEILKGQIGVRNEFAYKRSRLSAILFILFGATLVYLSSSIPYADVMRTVFMVGGSAIVIVSITNHMQKHYIARPNRWYYRRASKIKHFVIKRA